MGHRIPNERKKKGWSARRRTDSEDIPVCLAAPFDLHLMPHPYGGKVPGALAITVADTNARVYATTVTSLNRLPVGVTIKW